VIRIKLMNPSVNTHKVNYHCRSIRQFSLALVIVFGLHVDLTFAGISGVHIVGIMLQPPNFTSDPNSPNPPPNNCTLPPCLDLEFDLDIITECDLCAGTEGPEMRVVALDCDGHVVAEEHRSFPPTPPCTGPPAITRDPFVGVEFVFSACTSNTLISRVDVFTGFDHITTRPSTSDCSTPSEAKWNENPTASFDIPLPEMTCSLTAAELACYTCSDTSPLPPDTLFVYKSQHALYGLSANDTSGASYGEVVNGAFVAPGPGLLFIEPLSSVPSVSMWSSTINGSNFLGGWYTASGRTGSPLAGQQCYHVVSAGQNIDFHVRVGRVDSRFDYSLKFTWINTEKRNCCFQRSEETLTFQVRPFSDDSQPSDSSIPTRRKWVRHDGSVDYEMTTPLCTSCAGGGCSASNMSAPFIAWPTLDGTVIQEGHARGWSITANAIKTPGPQSTLYNY